MCQNPNSGRGAPKQRDGLWFGSEDRLRLSTESKQVVRADVGDGEAGQIR
jgi:hypothetical protein